MEAEELVDGDGDLETALLSVDSQLEEHHRPRSIRRFASNTTSQLAIIGSNLCPIESLDYEYFLLSPLMPVHLLCSN